MNKEQESDSGGRYSTVRRIFLATICGWTMLMVSLGSWEVHNIHQRNAAILLSEARSFFQLIVTTRAWNASHGGVYVPVNETTQPNPYLESKDRDLVIRPGMVLTLINPAYMTRQISELISDQSHIRFHITSLKPIRPANAADAWETTALKKFESGVSEYYQWLEPDSEKAGQFRYMAPLWVTKDCLRCHAKQGYAEGDLRGGIGVSLPTGPVLSAGLGHQRATFIIYAIIWTFGMLATIAAFWMLKRESDQREDLIGELHKALKDVKTLKGLIPICASCKRIRNDKGYWEKIEKYIRERSDAKFTHGMCPECMRQWYPDIEKDGPEKK